MNISDGTVVTLEYVLTDSDGNELDRAGPGDDFSYLHGAGNIVPGLEKALAGKAKGDKVDVLIQAADAYGEKTDRPTRTVPRKAFPPKARLAAGMQFGMEDEEGNHVPAWVVKTDADRVYYTLDHPLAGLSLHFIVTVLDLREATADEKDHGHPHGPHGHHH